MKGIFDNLTVTSIGELVTSVYPKGRLTSVSCRPSYALSFCVEGQITYNHYGRKYVSNKNVAIILPEGQSYTLYGDESGLFPVINFKCEGFSCDTHKVIPIENTESFVKDYENLRSLAVLDGNRMKMLSIFYNMLHRLSVPTTHGILAPALKYIEEHYSDPRLAIAEPAQACGISEVYFRRLFAERYKTSPKQFIIDIRMNKAKQLLSEGSLKISAISELCGFSNPYHFCRVFKTAFGVTPTEYMLENRVLKI